MKTKRLLLAISLFMFSAAQGQIITTVAGTGHDCGWLDSVAATAARMSSPAGVAIDAGGNLYIADRTNAVIRKVSAATGKITRIIGTGMPPPYTGDGGPATAATLQDPYGIALDAAGNIYFTDGGTCVRKVSASGIITRVAGTPGVYGYNGDNIPATDAQLDGATGLAIDLAGNLIVADAYNHRVRKISPTGIITTIAGTGVMATTGNNGPATAADLAEPNGIAIDATGNIYVGDQNNARCVRKIDVGGIITLFAGTPGVMGDAGNNGPATSAQFARPAGVAVDAAGNVYISDPDFNKVRKVNPAGIITHVAGLTTGGAGYWSTGGRADTTGMDRPLGMCADASGNLFVAEYGNCVIRKIASILAVDNLDARELMVYPNPSRGKFTFDLPNTQGEQISIVITNILGEKVKQVTPDNLPFEIQLNQPPGIYLISAFTGRGVVTKKVIVE